MATPKLVLSQHGVPSLLPVELVEAVHQAYFLHQLATEPEKVIPPGKTLLSMMIQSQINSANGDAKEEGLLNRVKEVAHKAFWDEAAEALSSPLPSVQIPRLKRLYSDLLDVLAPLFPPDHPIIKTLEASFAPSSSPLHSTLAFLKELLLNLKARCAPVRDEGIDELYKKLDEWRDPISNRVSSSESKDSDSTSPSPLAVLVVDTIRGIIALADLLKSDLNTAILGATTEAQLKPLLIEEAKSQEREIVLKIWDDQQEPRGRNLRERWRSWIAELPDPAEATFGVVPPDKRWILRLVMALKQDVPVSCSLPAAFVRSTEETQATAGSTNELPPQCLLVSNKLLYLQNFLQAIVIAAALRALTRLPVTRPTNPGEQLPPGHDFMSRVWSLLKTEIDVDEGEGEPGNINVGETKIINLADEVIRARRLASSSGNVDPAEEGQLRNAVERTLRPQDPVFILLRRRLIDSIGKELVQKAMVAETKSPRQSNRIPDVMKTGRERPDERRGKRPRLIVPEPDESTRPRQFEPNDLSLVINGFEDPALLNPIGECYRQISISLEWIEVVWGDLI